jgi:hypothetical protein
VHHARALGGGYLALAWPTEAALRLSFVQRPRNCSVSTALGVEYVFFHTTLGRYLAYVFWRRRPAVVWSILLQVLLRWLERVRVRHLLWQVRGRRWRLHLWLRRLLILYGGRAAAPAASRCIFVGMPHAHGARRLRRMPCRRRRLSRAAVT